MVSDTAKRLQTNRVVDSVFRKRGGLCRYQPVFAKLSRQTDDVTRFDSLLFQIGKWTIVRIICTNLVVFRRHFLCHFKNKIANKKETLAQVFTDIRYTKRDNESMSAGIIDTLKRQGFNF